MLRIMSGVVLLIVTIGVQAMTEGRLLSQSSSGQTVVFNLGVHDGIKEGDYAVLAKRIQDVDVKDLRVVPVAKAKNIKLNLDSSIWILYQVYDAKLLKNGEKFLVLAESVLLNGKRDPEQGRVNVIGPKTQGAASATQAVTQDQDRLSKLKMEYRTESELHGKQDKMDGEIELIDLEEWEKVRGVSYKTALYRSPNREEFRRNFRLETFQKMVTEIGRAHV